MVVKLADSQHRGCQFDSSVCHIKKMPLMRKATGNHLIKSTFLEKTQSLSLVSGTLEIEYAMQLKKSFSQTGDILKEKSRVWNLIFLVTTPSIHPPWMIREIVGYKEIQTSFKKTKGSVEVITSGPANIDKTAIHT